LFSSAYFSHTQNVKQQLRPNVSDEETAKLTHPSNLQCEAFFKTQKTSSLLGIGQNSPLYLSPGLFG
jgi:hypothetical protein